MSGKFGARPGAERWRRSPGWFAPASVELWPATRGPAMQENTAATKSALTDRLRFVKLDAKERGRIQGTQADHRAGAADRARQVLRPGPPHRGGAEVLPRGRSHRKRQERSDQSLAGDQLRRVRQPLLRQCDRDRARRIPGSDRSRRWYIGGYSLIIEHLVSAIITEVSAQRLLRGGKAEANKFGRRSAALDQGRADRHGFRILRLPR